MKKGKRENNMLCRIKIHGSSDWGKLLNLNQVNKEEYIVRYKMSWWKHRTLNKVFQKQPERKADFSPKDYNWSDCKHLNSIIKNQETLD